MGKSPYFQYTPLQPREIRLLTLFPGELQLVVKCEIDHMSLDIRPKYEALCYSFRDPMGPESLVQAHGDVDRNHQISVNKQSFSVDYNLFNALK